MYQNSAVEGRETKTTREQKETLLLLIEAHPDFAKGKFLRVEQKSKRNNLWEELGGILNSEK